jgi:SAM-dependent methyltransferase
MKSTATTIRTRKTLLPRLPQIAIRIRQAENGIKQSHGITNGNGDPSFALKGPRNPWYSPTPMLLTIEHLERVQKELELSPDSHVAVLGSGLGNSSIAAAEVFDRVTGFEIVPDVLQEAVKIRDQFGISNIKYQQQDLLDADLGPFDVIYFYKPYTKESVFLDLMERFIQTKPGTAIISRKHMSAHLLAPNHFRYLAPLANLRFPRTSDAEPFPNAEFYTFVKK